MSSWQNQEVFTAKKTFSKIKEDAFSALIGFSVFFHLRDGRMEKIHGAIWADYGNGGHYNRRRGPAVTPEID